MAAPYLLKLLVASKFQGAVYFIMLGAIIELCRTFGNLLSNAAQVTRKTTSLTAPYATGSIITFTLIYLAGILNLPLQIGGIALTIGAAAMLAIMWMHMSKQVSLKIDMTRWLLAALAMLIMSLSVLWLPREIDLLSGVYILTLGAIISGVIAVTLLWKSAALKRLLSIKLKEE